MATFAASNGDSANTAKDAESVAHCTWSEQGYKLEHKTGLDSFIHITIDSNLGMMFPLKTCITKVSSIYRRQVPTRFPALIFANFIFRKLEKSVVQLCQVIWHFALAISHHLIQLIPSMGKSAFAND